ncbi:cytochrome P450 [Actinoalloteichus hymeniacidonis]|uniref:Cytochrome P450 n=1 Tax=Actinoalloteichus hymeniacidonis TaxID=340345 RepID=A0AAC9HQH1_9PSEU|nr:cytochrome P450 [Actinoalloteichus hymeniacidonis]AOS63697.1 cytochrome P450 [Actinoalloteichus hymeniacidonis]MBB5908250.1 cytochrome P450 [Actinoalloteichus hymeniacidonis]
MTDIRPTSDALHTFPAIRDCPFSAPQAYADLRREGAASRVRLPTGRQAWVITGYHDVRAILADRRVSADVRNPNYPALVDGEQEVGARTRPFIRMDPPEHTRFRRMLLAEMTVRKARRMRRSIQRIVDERIDELLAAGPPIDLVTHYAHTVSTTVMCELIGVRRADPWFRRITGALGSGVFGGGASTAQGASDGIAALSDVLDGLITDREQDLGEDLLSTLIKEQLHPGLASRAELITTVAILVVAGWETTTNQIALSVLALLNQPELITELQQNPSRVPDAVEELLRVLSVGDSIALRIATEDLQVGDQVIPAGDGIIPLLAAADHDPAVFPDPERIDLDRRGRQHVAFSFGIHQCVGQNIARLELAIAIGTLLDRIPTLRAAVPLHSVRFRNDGIAFGPERVLVTW